LVGRANVRHFRHVADMCDFVRAQSGRTDMDIPLRGCPFVQGVGQPFCVLLRLLGAWLIRQRVRDPVSTRKINNVSRFHGGVSPSVGLLPSNNKSTRYAANLQTAQTPDSVIARNTCIPQLDRIVALCQKPCPFQETVFSDTGVFPRFYPQS